MPDTDGTLWDVTVPSDSGNVNDGAGEIRALKLELALRSNKEHSAYGTSSAGGEHLAGSAVAYYQSSFPTQRPDGATDLDSDDAGRLIVRSSDGSLWYWNGTGFVLVQIASLNAIANGLIDKTKMATGFTGGIYPIAVIVDQKTSGTDGGTFTSGSWQQRNLNTEICDNGSIIAGLSSNQITLNAGTYRVEASAPGQQCGSHQIRWYDQTNSNTIAYGTTESSPSGSAYQTRSTLTVEFTVASDSTVFQLQHRCSSTKSGSGLGLNGGFGGAEIYSQVKIYKLL